MINQVYNDFSDLKSDSQNWVKRKKIALETIEATFVQMGLGTKKEEKQLKYDLLFFAFQVVSWEAVCNMQITAIELGRDLLIKVKDKWLTYCKECVSSELKIDLSMMRQFMDEVQQMQEKSNKEVAELLGTE